MRSAPRWSHWYLPEPSSRHRSDRALPLCLPRSVRLRLAAAVTPSVSVLLSSSTLSGDEGLRRSARPPPNAPQLGQRANEPTKSMRSPEDNTGLAEREEGAWLSPGSSSDVLENESERASLETGGMWMPVGRTKRKGGELGYSFVFLAGVIEVDGSSRNSAYNK
ncbi:uncharacterized protein BJ171DRAFT_144262 [Polychytrium aggregatum]|uniref:uncharacterized protein n=1 Tax=Polychytrium aggregatum TaxID=110093 RepID=UPI0022FEAFCF|nr:uncharacterized protein BJ171DRAFT_144262 [Polychytrium aggregatum]KAI9203457.1 hypothetical protein BJ171DRAFT_144262 [Polychytrium aggregatum]